MFCKFVIYSNRSLLFAFPIGMVLISTIKLLALCNVFHFRLCVIVYCVYPLLPA